MFRRAASQVDEILRGAKPGEIARRAADQVSSLVVNLKTAKTLGLEISTNLLAAR